MRSLRTRLQTVLVTLAIAIPPAALAQDKRASKDNPGPEPAIAALDMAAMRAAHDAYLEHGELQLERPEPRPAPQVRSPSPPPDWLLAIGKFFAGIFTALGPFLRILIYLLIAALVAALIWFIAGEAFNLRLGGNRGKKSKDEDDVIADLRPGNAAARSLLDEADALARAGRFAEAVHLLLFRSIEDIQSRQGGTVSRDLTAREIGRLDTLPEKPRSALSPIIAIVEHSFFGGRDVDEAGWKEARTSYEVFAFGEAWS